MSTIRYFCSAVFCLTMLAPIGCGNAAVEQEVFRKVKEKGGKIDSEGKGPEITFSNAKVTDDDLAELAKLQHIHRLTLEFVDITDEGIEHLLKLDSLDIVKFRETKVTEEGLLKLKAKFPHLNIP